MATSLPLVLPFDRTEIRTDVRTDTVQCTDEVHPLEEKEEEEDSVLVTRGKGSLHVIVRIGNGERVGKHESTGVAPRRKVPKKKNLMTTSGSSKQVSADAAQIPDAPSDDGMQL